MKKIIKTITAIMSAAFIFTGIESSACDMYNEEPELLKGRVTAYYVSGTTASESQTRPGICAAKSEWLGKTVVIYKRLPNGAIGDIIGIYECLDTGGTDAIKKGYVIDIWVDGPESCKDLMDFAYEDDCEGKIYIQVVDAVG